MSLKTRYVSNGNITRIYDVDSSETKLPSRNYAVMHSSMSGFYLENRESFDLPKKIYGRSLFPERVLNTYSKMNKGIGVLLSGPKGTGKTVEAKQICVNSQKPVILIGSAFSGPEFQSFIETIETPSIIFIDEFEKVYADTDARNFFLSVMDGVAKSRHLYLLTSNSSDIGEFFSSRPGRVRYHKHYDFLTEELINEIVYDKLENKDHLDTVIQNLIPLNTLSMDSLVCIIEECNLYDEVPKDFLGFFNVNSERRKYFNVELHMKQRMIKPSEYSEDELKLIERAIFNYNMYRQESPILLKHSEEVEVIYKSDFCAPFGEDTNSGEQPIPDIYCSSLYSDLLKQNYTVNWDCDTIKDFTENRSGFRAVHNSGAILIGKPNTTIRASF